MRRRSSIGGSEVLHHVLATLTATPVRQGSLHFSQQPPRSIRTGPREGSKVSGVIVTERQLLVTALALGLFQRGRSRGVEPRAEISNRCCSPHRPPSFLECLSRSVGWNRGLEACCVGEQLVKHVDGSFGKRPSCMHWDAAGEVGLVRG